MYPYSIGSVVVLNSGGPDMVVLRIHYGKDELFCVWLVDKDSDEVDTGTFPALAVRNAYEAA